MMFIYLCIALITSIQCTQSTVTTQSIKSPDTTIAKHVPPAIPLTYVFDYEASVIFQAINLPLQDVQDAFTLNIFAQIEANFGTKGLNLNADQIILIKKTYLYLIFLAKLNLVQHNPAFKKYQSDFALFLKDNNSSLPHIPDSKLVKSAGWNAVTITNSDITSSPMWQQFCKAATCDAYAFFYTALNIIHNVEQQTFNYIPHIETSFYDHDYTNLRSINELVRLKVILETTNKNFYVAQCSEWASTKSTNKTPLEKEIVAFRHTTFYKNTHDIYTLLGIPKDNNPTISTQKLLTPQQLASPLKEQVWCFFMLNELLTMLYGCMTPDTLEDVLFYCSQDNLSPTIFPYSLDDYVYFEELLAIKSKTENTHTQSLHPSPPVHKKEETHLPITMHNALHKIKQSLNQNVKPQCFLGLCHIGSDIENAAEDVYGDVKSGVEEFGDAIADAAEAAAHAVAGAAEGVFGAAVGILGNITGIESVEAFGSTVQKDALSNLESATTDMQESIDHLASGIKDGIAAYASIEGSMISIITDDQKLGQDFETVFDQVSGALVNVGAKYADLVVQGTGDYVMAEVKISDQFADLVSSAVSAMYTGNFDAVGQNAQSLLNGTISSITQSFSNLVSAGKEILGAVMQGLGAIMNSLTTIFIDIAREITFMVAAAGNLAADVLNGQFSGSDFEDALHNAKSVRDSITNTLEAHRSTINQVMGVAVAIGFTVATEVASGGAATGEDTAIDAELISGDIGETGASTATDTTAGAAEDTEEVTAPETTPAPETTSETAPEPETTPETEPEAETNEEEAKEEGNWKESLKKGFEISLKAFGNILNIVFGTFSIISGINADAQDALKEQQQSEQLINIWEFINDNKIAIVQNQGAYLQELQQKQQATIGNQILGLAFIKNITYAGVNQLEQQLSTVLAKEFIPLLTPDTNGMLGADIGSSWGIQSPYLDLYPTQGFSTVTTGRLDFPFAQEVAQAPYAAQDLATTSTAKVSSPKNNKQSKKLWFNQKVIALDKVNASNKAQLPTDPLHVAIDLQIIYMVNADFYTGLYLGGNYHDYTSSSYVADLTKNQDFDIDAAHLAKMVVLFRTSATAPLQIGIYEHEGKGWILQETLPDNMQLATYHTYNLSATLDGDFLTIKVSIENDRTSHVTKTVPVTKIENQRTYGIISSGTAIQWNQSSPEISIAINRQARPPYGKTSEIEREKRSKIMMAQATNPQFGSMNLQATSQQAIVHGQYLYATTDTNLKKVSPTNNTDYVIFAINQNGSITHIGSAPSNKKNNSSVIVSVITGNAYDAQGNIVAHSGGLWQTYQSAFGPFSTEINTYITTVQKQIEAALSHITFGSFDLDIIDATALQNGQYIYTCKQTINATDAAGKTILDYLIPVEITNNELGNMIGMPPTSPTAQGLVSLVTGNLYSKTIAITAGTVPAPLNNGYWELNAYENQFNNIDPTALSDIKTAQAAYNAYITAQQAQQVQAKTVTVQTFTSSPATNATIAPTSTGPSLGGGPDINLSSGPGSQGTIASLQQQAAGSAGFQEGTPAGPSVPLGNGP